MKQWIDAEATTSLGMGDTTKPPANHGLVENEWARVWGRLKAFNNRRHVGAHVIRPVGDKMEVMYHLLEATYVHLYFTRGPLEPGGDGKGAGAGAGMNGQMDGGYGGGDTIMAGATKMPNVSVSARRVYQCLKEMPQSNEGLHVQNIAANTRMSVTDVMKAGDELLSHSLIFTTVDDATWALLEF